MLDQRRRRWADVVKMLYKYYVFAGIIMDDRLPNLLQMCIASIDH